jgi:hypothetical protein
MAVALIGCMANKLQNLKFLTLPLSVAPDFWPAAADIENLCSNTLDMNLKLALIALHYAAVSDVSPSVLNTTTGYLKFKISNVGLDSVGAFTVSMVPYSGFASVGSSKIYNLTYGQHLTDSIAFTLSNATTGSVHTYLLQVDNGSFVLTDTITKVYVPISAVFSNSGNSMTGFNSSAWGVDNSLFVSSPASIGDSPAQDYLPNTYTYNTTVAINLTNATYASLTFKLNYDIEQGYDYAQVLGSTNGGINWTPLCGKYSKTGGPFQDVGNPLYDGISGGWLDEEIDLQPIIGHTVLLRFQMISDGFIEGNGINIDDVTINTNISQSIIETTTSTTVVPNPASNKVAIQHKGKATTVTISNATGQVVKQINVDANQTLILDISTWPDGMYFYATPHMPTKKWVVMH